MNKLKVVKIIKDVQFTLGKHSPGILTGIGIAGMVTTTVLAVKATPKALKLIEEAKAEKIATEKEKGNIPDIVSVDILDCKLTPMETVKATWKCYIPAVISGMTSTGCLLGANSINSRRNAALTAAYKISETALSEYKDKVVETIGEKKEQVIKDKIAKDKVERNPVSKSEVILTEKGTTLCYDAMSGRYFKSDMEQIKRAINEINRNMLSYDYVSLNEFYEEIGLPSIQLGDDLGWNLSRDGMVEPDFTSLITDDGTPCIVIGYIVAPRYDYSKLM